MQVIRSGGRALATAALAVAFAASASASTTIAGSVTDIEVRDVDPGLVINASPLSFAPFTLNNVGDFFDVNVLTVGTGESTVNFGEDTVPYSISASFAFTSPEGATGSPITGSTFGFIIPFTTCGIIAGGCGRVEWGSPSTFSFGNGGQFSVQLFDASFGTPGTADVRGRFTLLSSSAPAVPEPGTWAMMLLGFTGVGVAMRRRRHGLHCTQLA